MPAATKDKGPTTGPAEFAIINPKLPVDGNQGRHQPQEAAFGILADVPGYGRLLRWTARGATGNACFGYRRLDARDPARPPEELHSPRDEIGALLDEVESAKHSPRARLRALEPSPLEVEVSRFRAAWPCISEALGLVKLRPTRRFQPGRVMVPPFDDRVGDIDCSHYVDLHTSGSFGTIGEFSADVPTDPASLFVRDLADRLTKNCRAIVEGAGLVVSRYSLDGAPTAGLALSVITALMGHNTVTMVKIVGADQPV